jgi:hypothetical protein
MGKKSEIKLDDFISFGNNLKLKDKQIENVFTKINNGFKKIEPLFISSVISESIEDFFRILMYERFKRMELIN